MTLVNQGYREGSFTESPPTIRVIFSNPYEGVSNGGVFSVELLIILCSGSPPSVLLCFPRSWRSSRSCSAAPATHDEMLAKMEAITSSSVHGNRTERDFVILLLLIILFYFFSFCD
jgi:hypothetical protein